MDRRIKINVVKETATKVTIEMISLHRKMPVPKEVFLERVENGEYQIMNGYDIEKLKPTSDS